MFDNKIKIFDTPELAAAELSLNIKNEINDCKNMFNLSVSGGNTPRVLFKTLASPEFANKVNWNKLQLWWCDERCVPPGDSESNYGMTKNTLLRNINLPEDNVHRIKGEAEPSKETVRYAMEIEKILCNGNNCMPVFDRVLLGLGEDGHTASIFPDSNLLFIYSNIAGVAQHPVSLQNRITLTINVLNNAKKITFFVTGREKAKILSEIVSRHPIIKHYPAAEVKPAHGFVEFFLDKEAAFYL